MRKFWAMLLGVALVAPCAYAQVEATVDAPSPSQSSTQSRSMRKHSMSFNDRLPDAPSARPLTDREKFQLFTDDARSPLTFISAGFTAGYNTVENRVYGDGWGGFGKNYATAMAEHETASFLGKYLFPALLSQDPRYHPSEKDGFWRRSTYAASRVLITKSDSGQKTVNSSYLLGALVSTAIAACYRPYHRTAGQTMVDFGTTVGGDAGMNIAKEFWPQVRSRLTPLAPKKLRDLTNRLVGKEQPQGLVDLNQR